jgi:ribose transport system permease protein
VNPFPHRAADLLPRYALPALLLGSILLYSFWRATSDVFATAENARNIMTSQAMLGVLTLGLLLPLVAGHLDLSVGNTAGLAAVLTASAYADWDLPIWLGVLVGVAAGALVGTVNGLLVMALRVDSIVITLGTGSVTFAVVNWYSGGQSIIDGVPMSVMAFAAGSWLGVPPPFVVLLLAAGAVGFLLGFTRYGRILHAIGANRQAARLIGIRVRASVCGAFVAAGLLAGGSGVLLLCYTGSGNPQLGPELTLTAVAAAFVGATAFRPGQMNVAGSLVAIYLIAVNVTGLQFAGVGVFVEHLFTGAALVLAIAIAAVLTRRRDRLGEADVGTPSPVSAAAEQTV